MDQSAYRKQLWGKVQHEIKWSRDLALGAAMNIATLVLNVSLSLISEGEWKAHKGALLLVIIAPYAIVLIPHFAWVFWRCTISLYEEQRTQKESAENALRTALEQPPITAKDWQELAGKVSGACQHFRADYQVDTKGGYECWEVKGGYQSGICEALITQAGAMLTASPRVFADLPQDVQREADPKTRWLKYMKTMNYFDGDRVIPSQLADGTPMHILGGTTRNLSLDFTCLCLLCSAKETEKKT